MSASVAMRLRKAAFVDDRLGSAGNSKWAFPVSSLRDWTAAGGGRVEAWQQRRMKVAGLPPDEMSGAQRSASPKAAATTTRSIFAAADHSRFHSNFDSEAVTTMTRAKRVHLEQICPFIFSQNNSRSV